MLFKILLALSFTAISASAACEESSQHVSLYRLIANPDEFHGKKVYVTGFVRIGLENMSICPSRHALSYKDCLWLRIDEGEYETQADMVRFDRANRKWRQFNRQVVSVRATFDKNETGHFGLWSGGLTHIVQVQRTERQ